MSIIPPPTDVALMPSDVVPVTPTKVDEAPQQGTILLFIRSVNMLSLRIIASTAPGDGHVVHDNPHEKEESTDQSPTQTSHNKVPFREQVIGLLSSFCSIYEANIETFTGYAQKTRGTVSRLVSAPVSTHLRRNVRRFFRRYILLFADITAETR
jgi:hypothetical protein